MAQGPGGEEQSPWRGSWGQPRAGKQWEDRLKCYLPCSFMEGQPAVTMHSIILILVPICPVDKIKLGQFCLFLVGLSGWLLWSYKRYQRINPNDRTERTLWEFVVSCFSVLSWRTYFNAESGSHLKDLDSNLVINEAQESAFNKHPYDFDKPVWLISL